MTNSEQAIREFAEKWGWFVKATSFDMTQFELNKDTEQCLSDLTALISEHYVAKEEVDKMVSERLRNELMRYDQWLLANDMGQMFDDTMKCVDEYLNTRER